MHFKKKFMKKYAQYDKDDCLEEGLDSDKNGIFGEYSIERGKDLHENYISNSVDDVKDINVRISSQRDRYVKEEEVKNVAFNSSSSVLNQYIHVLNVQFDNGSDTCLNYRKSQLLEKQADVRKDCSEYSAEEEVVRDYYENEYYYSDEVDKNSENGSIIYNDAENSDHFEVVNHHESSSDSLPDISSSKDSSIGSDNESYIFTRSKINCDFALSPTDENSSDGRSHNNGIDENVNWQDEETEDNPETDNNEESGIEKDTGRQSQFEMLENTACDKQIEDNYQSDLQYQFFINNDTWKTIKPRNDVKRRGLQGDWTDVFYNEMRKKAPGCVAAFKSNRVRAMCSRKTLAPFFRGRAICTDEACHVHFEITIKNEPREEENVPVNVLQHGTCHHDQSHQNKRKVKGDRRRRLAENIICKGAFNVYNEHLAQTSKLELERGNRSTPQTMEVMRKIASEAVSKELRHTDNVRDLELLADSFNLDPEGSFIQHIGVRPFMVMCFSSSQLQFLKTLEQKMNLYLDATGSVIHKVGGQKRPLLYSIVMSLKNQSPCSVADMISTDHTVPVVSFFLLRLRHAYGKVNNTVLQPEKIETDKSWALINSCLMVFNQLSVKGYINVCWKLIHREYSTEYITKLTVVHLCAAHMIKAFGESITDIIGRQSKQKHLKEFCMQFFALLQNCTSLEKAAEILKLGTIVLKSSNLTEIVKRSLRKLQKMGNTDTVNDTSNDSKSENDNTNEGSIFMEVGTIAECSPFYSYFSTVVGKVNVASRRSDLPENVLYNERVLQKILHQHTSTFPLWSGIMLHKMQYSSKFESTEFLECAQSRDTTSAVEAWFKMIKKNQMQSKPRQRPSTFILALRKTVLGRLRDLQFPCNLSKNIKRKQKRKQNLYHNKEFDLAEEIWDRTPKKTKKEQKPSTNQDKQDKQQNTFACEKDEAVGSHVEASDRNNVIKESCQKKKQSNKSQIHTKPTQKKKIEQYKHAKKNKFMENKSKLVPNPCNLPNTRDTNVQNEVVKRRLEGEIKSEKNTYSSLDTFSVPKWGGETARVKLINTCTIDNFLTIAFVAYMEDGRFRRNLQDFSHHQVIEKLLSCLSLMKNGLFPEAKLMWTESDQSGGLVNLFGSEYDNFVKEIQYLIHSETIETCNNEMCPAGQNRRKKSKGLQLRLPDFTQDAYTVQSMVDAWQGSFSSRCSAKYQASDPRRKRFGYMDKTRVEVDDTFRETVSWHCSGTKTVKGDLDSLVCPPVVVLQVCDLGNSECFLQDIRALDTYIRLGDVRYRLAGVTSHRPGHFFSLINSLRQEWLHYDGLNGKLLQMDESNIGHLQCLVYVEQ